MFGRATASELPHDPGTTWVEAWSGQEFLGGQLLKANAPLERIPVYWCKDSKYQFRF